METKLAAVGPIILVIGVFGYIYAENQQDLRSQAEDIIQGEDMDWPLIRSLSLAGAVLRVILLAAGFIPEDWSDRAT
jgi:hypothetical protein